MHSTMKIAFGTFALAAVMSLAGCGGSTTDGVANNQLSQTVNSAGLINQTPVIATQVEGSGVHGFNGDATIFVPETSMASGSGIAHTNHLIKLPNSNGASANAAIYYTPAQMHTAYNVPSGAGSGTIVIVDAYDDKFALADFNAFSTQWGLPTETSTNVTSASNQHLQVVYASGSKPAYNAGWSQEASLDIEWAHAMAPNAKIVLVECSSSLTTALYQGDTKASTIANTHQVSNSWGGGESSGEAGSDGTFTHAGIVYFFSSGDTGGQRQYPAASSQVVAVGGTTLTLDANNNRVSETAWNGTGCGPSAYIARPAFQNGVSGVVGTKRGIADIAGVADPNTGVIVRWNGGWYIFGGTSVACPIIAGITNVAGTNRGSGPNQNTQFYAGLGGANFFDVTSGTAGSFSAAAGYDFPTGVGSPKGIAGF